MPPPQRQQPQPQDRSAILANVVGKAVSVVVVLGISLNVFAYRRSLTPLYGTAPVELHLNKISWLACAIGSLLPLMPLQAVVLALGLLLCAMPNTSYWVAVYTGRLHEPIWGPVFTHLVVFTPVVALGVLIVRVLQHNPNPEEGAAPQQMITLPVIQTSVMSLQELWPLLPHVKKLSNESIMLQAGTAVIVAWAVYPLLPSLIPATSSPAPVPAPRPSASSQSKSKSPNKKKGAVTKSVLSTLDDSSSPLPAPKKVARQYFSRLLLLPFLPFLTATILQPPTLVGKPFATPYLHPSHPVQILSSVQSQYSGAVVVGEALADSPPGVPASVPLLRYLRAGHSLLGGNWMGEDVIRRGPLAVHRETGEMLGDSVYNAFVLQEAIRLVERPGHDAGERESALVIGLGVGTSATALMRHNISTTLVEIDETVYEAARKYFALPEPESGKLVLKDARKWLRERARDIEAEAGETGQGTSEELYDYVIHDVFSGGSLPALLFTKEFWNSTKKVMKPSGVLAANFAGKLKSPSSRAIIATLESMFGHCRAFCDEVDPQEQPQPYHNWLLLCSASSTTTLSLRAPTLADFLGSPQRANVLSTLTQREVDLQPVRDAVAAMDEKKREQFYLTDANVAGTISKWQEQDALDHWRIMREVLPDPFWETY
ncbi:S-adenosyl-L-methionine-dependent methyltransferase [Daedalea quercina L-15889]|uniref:S-adenosyl-L-methionine-dependent methyltransferase n=1 Tax=Daedalea quercina L-15889 TaxID=1314783 RepID=A0A165U518_9APHY|nr:S-adenosyl-L-methionine-dependent methyltransferase [Daedalea quercina L-15889]